MEEASPCRSKCCETQFYHGHLPDFRKETSYPLLFKGKCEAKEAYYAVLSAAVPEAEIDKWEPDYISAISIASLSLTGAKGKSANPL